MKKYIPILLVIVLITVGIIWIRANINDQGDTFIQKHIDHIYSLVPNAVVFNIELYETDDEKFLYIAYYLDETGTEERFVVATKVSNQRVTMATQELFPHIMDAFSDAQARHNKKITLSEEEIQFYVNNVPN